MAQCARMNTRCPFADRSISKRTIDKKRRRVKARARLRPVGVHVRACRSNTHTIVGGMQTLDSTQAILLPIGASVSLLVMFFFFDSLQTVFALCTAVIATIAFAFLLLPMCQYLIRPCSDGHK